MQKRNKLSWTMTDINKGRLFRKEYGSYYFGENKQYILMIQTMARN